MFPWNQVRRQDLVAGGPKTRSGGHIFKIQYWMYAVTGGPNVKWGGTDFKWGAGHHWPPAGDGPAWNTSFSGVSLQWNISVSDTSAKIFILFLLSKFANYRCPVTRFSKKKLLAKNFQHNLHELNLMTYISKAFLPVLKLSCPSWNLKKMKLFVVVWFE